MSKLIFSKDFLWGAATASYQIEGAHDEDGKGESIWDRFSHTPGKILNGDTGDIACDHYHLYKQDIEAMKRLGINTYRFSFAWPRVLPDGSGHVNQKGLDFYRRLVDGLLNAGIVPNATLYHWDLPQKLQDKGGWANRNIVGYFEEYSHLMFKEFGDSIPLWTTFNEPMLVYFGYSRSDFAPGLADEKLGRHAVHNILLSHGTAVRSFNKFNFKKSEIGIVIDIWRNLPARNCKEDIEMAEDLNERAFRSYLNPIFKGRYTDYLTGKMLEEGTMPEIKNSDMDIISTPLDFLGVNCYSRSIVSRDDELNDIDRRIAMNPDKFAAIKMEICPEAIYDTVKMVKDEYHGTIPIYITENGCPLEEEISEDGGIHDNKRIFYVKNYLRELHRAIQDGVNVKGYYLWSLMDNFEWNKGYKIRCGIIYVDYKTQARIWKDSAYWYKDVINNNGIDV